jgi:hypothetical protein
MCGSGTFLQAAMIACNIPLILIKEFALKNGTTGTMSLIILPLVY